jgi:hypothetical protein
MVVIVHRLIETFDWEEHSAWWVHLMLVGFVWGFPASLSLSVSPSLSLSM